MVVADIWDRHSPENEEACPWILAGYEKHASHQCVFQQGHLGRHQCEHGRDGGWNKIGSHRVG